MRKLSLFSILLAGIICWGCSDEDLTLKKAITDQVEISSSEIIMPASGRETDKTYITSDLDWVLEGANEWCSFSPEKGGGGTTMVTFTLKPNESYVDRSVNLTLTAGGKKSVVTVYQKKKDAIILSKDKFDNIPADGAVITVDLETNIDYVVEISPSDREWIKQLSKTRASAQGLTDKTVSFQIESTSVGEERIGTIYFMKSDDDRFKDSVKVFQVQRDILILNPTEVKVPLEGRPQLKVDLRFNVDYRIEIPDGAENWIHIINPLQKSMRADELWLEIDPAEANREGKVIVTDKNNPSLSSVLLIHQLETESLIFSEHELSVEKAGQVYELKVLDNIQGKYELYIPPYATWVEELPRSRALSENTFKIKINENADNNIRRITRIYVRGIENKELKDSVVITQKGGREIPEDERITLMRIAAQLNWDNWASGSKKTWGYEEDITKFYNITVRDGKVVAFKYFTEMKGDKIPEEIGDLIHLEELSINTSSYYIKGEIPKSLANLKNLKKLTLYGTYKEDIPIEMAGMENLEEIIFYGKWQDGNVMKNLGSFESLKKVTISYGGTAAIPEEWANLKNLKQLSISYGDFAGYSAIGGMENLEVLSLNRCTCKEEIPESFGNLVNLNTLTLTYNSFTKMFESIGNLKKATKIDITGNASLLGAIPESIGECESLLDLKISANALSGSIPESIGNLTRLQKLNLSSHPNLSGSIPESIGNLAALTELTMNANGLTGSLPETMSGLVSLSVLNLSGCQLEGDLPEGFGQMSKLKNVNLSNNKLTGLLPASIGLLEKVTTFNLSKNQISGLPAEIGGMKALATLNMEQNDLQGAIPSTIGNLLAVKTLNLKNNKLSGSIPNTFSNKMIVTSIDLSLNNLSGRIPQSLGTLPSIATLNLNDNRLEGSIPVAITALKTMKTFNLSNNQLDGEIPVEFKNLNVTSMYLFNNNLSGSIPEGLLGITTGNGTRVNISGNRLSGEVPQGVLNRMSSNANIIITPQQDGYNFTNYPVKP